MKLSNTPVFYETSSAITVLFPVNESGKTAAFEGLYRLIRLSRKVAPSM